MLLHVGKIAASLEVLDMAEWWLLWAWRIIAVLGVGAVLIWMARTIKAMKGTVDAQKETISAQAVKMASLEML